MSLTFIVGTAKAFRAGRHYQPGERITIPNDTLPSRTWVWPNGAPVEFDEVIDKKGNNIGRKLKPMGKPPDADEPPSEEDEIAALELELEQRKEALKARLQPALSQVKNPPKSPGAADGNKQPQLPAGAPQGSRPSDQSPT